MKLKLIAITLFIILTASFPVFDLETATATNVESTSVIQSDIFVEPTSSFSLEITNISLNILGSENPEEIEPGLYQLRSSLTDTPVSLYFNFSGYTNWYLGNQSWVGSDNQTHFYNFNETTYTLGQLFSIVNGNVEEIFQYEWAFNVEDSELTPVTLALPHGDNTVTMLYLSRTPENDYIYAHDTLTISIAYPDEEFNNHIEQEFPLELSHTDYYSENSNISGTALTNVFGGYGYSYTKFHQPEMDSTVIYNSSIVENNEKLLLLNSSQDTISMSIETNSTGFEGLQTLREWESIQGLSFLLDANGIKLIDDVTYPDSITIRNGNNYLGSVTFSPYGIWHEDTPCELFCFFYMPTDWQALIYDYQIESMIVPIDSSFDFVYNSHGISILAALHDPNLDVQVIDTTESSFNTYFLLIVPFLTYCGYKLRKKFQRGNST